MHAWAAAVAGLLSSSCPLSQILLIALWALGLIVSFAVLPWSGVGSKNGVYYAVDQDTGALVWQQAVVAGGEAGGFSPSTGVAFGKIYAATFTGPPYIFALDATNGAVAWQCPPTECDVFSFGPAGIAGGLFFVGDSSRQLRAFDAGTGALLRKLDLGGIITSGPAIVNDMVFVGVGLGPTGEQQGVYGLALQGRHTAARARRTARGDRS